MEEQSIGLVGTSRLEDARNSGEVYVVLKREKSLSPTFLHQVTILPPLPSSFFFNMVQA